MLLFYIRHGDPTYSPDALTPLGRRQAESVARRLALFGIDRIFASTSNRAGETAAPTAELLKQDVGRLDFCHEGHAWDEFTVPDGKGGVTWAFYDPETCRKFNSPEVRALGSRWYTHPDFAGFRFAEGVARIDRETDAFLDSLGYRHDRAAGLYLACRPNEERIALFAHQGFGLAFLSSLLDLPYPLFATHFDLCHTGMTVIEFKEKGGAVLPKVLTLSADGHLYRDGLPLDYNHQIRF